MYLLENIKVKNILQIKRLLIPRGITCIVGESGAGKSTLLRLLNKMTPWDTGDIYYNGISLATINAVQLRRQMVMLPQNPYILPGTVRDNLLMGQRFAGVSEADDPTLRETLRRVALVKPLEADASAFSGGEKQRLALGRALLLKPEVLLLDEPSSALDAETEERLFQALTHAAGEQSCDIIMVTHSEALRTMADNIIALKKGEVVDNEVQRP